MKRQLPGSFIAVDITMLAGATALDGVDFTSKDVPVYGAEAFYVQLEAKGASAVMSGNLTAYFSASYDDDLYYDTFNAVSQAFGSVVLELTTNTLERHGKVLDVRGAKNIKLLAIINGDASNGLTDINVHYGRLADLRA